VGAWRARALGLRDDEFVENVKTLASREGENAVGDFVG